MSVQDHQNCDDEQRLSGQAVVSPQHSQGQQNLDDEQYLFYSGQYPEDEFAQLNQHDDQHDDSDNVSEISSDAEAPFRNESQIEAEESQKVHFELSSMSAQEIWDRLFSNKKLKGGYIARSLLVAARMIDSKVCEPWGQPHHPKSSPSTKACSVP